MVTYLDQMTNFTIQVAGQEHLQLYKQILSNKLRLSSP